MLCLYGMYKETHVIVVGQGIAGTLLSWFLHTMKIPFLVINNDTHKGTSLSVETGIINPVTGRRYVETWNIDSILPFAYNTYKTIEAFLNTPTITPMPIAQFFANAQMQQAFETRVNTWPKWLNHIEASVEDELHNYFNFRNNVGQIKPCYIVHIKNIIDAWQAFLIQQDKYISNNINTADINFLENGSMVVDNIKAQKIVFCGGVIDAFQPLFCKLPFSINKGEFIHIETTKPLPTQKVFKHNTTLVPLGTNRYWVGSNYIWQFNDVMPTTYFLQQQKNILDGFLKQPYTVTNHTAALRPATVERRPFVGFHPIHKSIGIFNGLGTKGCSLAPFYASQLASCIAQTNVIDAEADIKRFENILSK
jgi:hypothetical protein